MLVLTGKCDGEDMGGRKEEVVSAWEEELDQILQI